MPHVSTKIILLAGISWVESICFGIGFLGVRLCGTHCLRIKMINMFDRVRKWIYFFFRSFCLSISRPHPHSLLFHAFSPISDIFAHLILAFSALLSFLQRRHDESIRWRKDTKTERERTTEQYPLYILNNECTIFAQCTHNNLWWRSEG